MFLFCFCLPLLLISPADVIYANDVITRDENPYDNPCEQENQPEPSQSTAGKDEPYGDEIYENVTTPGPVFVTQLEEYIKSRQSNSVNAFEQEFEVSYARF